MRAVGAVGVLALSGATAFVAVRADGSGDDAGSTDGDAVPLEPAAPSATADNPVPGDTAQVVDVWLFDRGDGNFDWGAVLSSNADVVRGGLDVSAVALGDHGTELFSEQVVVERLVPDSSVAIGGAFRVADGAPIRMEVTATLGTALPDEVGVVFDVSDVRRIASGRIGSDDRLLGAVELVAGGAGPVSVAALWRDDEGRVVAAVFDELASVDIGVASEFSLRLPRNLVPSGVPDTIVVSALASS